MSVPPLERAAGRFGERSYEAPPLATPYVRLRPLMPADYGAMQAAELGGELSTRWRYRGTTPSPDQWMRSTWTDVLAQYLVLGARSEEPVGIVLAYRPNFQDGHAHIAAARFDPSVRSPVMVLGIGLFVDRVFACWDFHKLYMEVPEYNYSQFASGLGKHFDVEGRFRDHLYFNGERWDELVLAIYRDRWLSTRRPLDGDGAPA